MASSANQKMTQSCAVLQHQTSIFYVKQEPLYLRADGRDPEGLLFDTTSTTQRNFLIKIFLRKCGFTERIIIAVKRHTRKAIQIIN